MVNTLDDALSTPGEVSHGVFDGEIGDISFLAENESGPCAGTRYGVVLEGALTASELRRIADWLDPQADNVAAIRAEARREAFAEAEAQHLANREGYEAFCRAIGMEPDCYGVIAHQVNAKIGRARREALEEAAREAEAAAEKVSDQDESDVLTAYGAATAIRALIEKVPGKGEFPELTLKATEEIRREALEEAARICADLARHDCSALYAGECIRALIEQEPK